MRRRPFARWRRPRETPAAWRKRWVGWAITLALLAVVVVLLLRERDTAAELIDRAANAPAWAVTLMLLLPVGNWLVTSAAFWAPSVARGADRATRVRLAEMAALIGGSWLLNHLPLRPGLIGRLAYHKRYNGLTIKASTLILVLNAALGAVAMGVQAAVMLAIVGLWPGAPAGVAAAAIAGPTVVFGLAAGVAVRGRLRFAVELTTLTARQLDFTLWVLRYEVVFVVAGSPITLPDAVALAVVSQLALLVPIAGNGLGVRELAIGFVAPLLSAAHGELGQPGGGVDGEVVRSVITMAALADLIHRAAELAIAVPVGLGSIWWMSRWARRRERQRVARLGREPAADQGHKPGADHAAAAGAEPSPVPDADGGVGGDRRATEAAGAADRSAGTPADSGPPPAPEVDAAPHRPADPTPTPVGPTQTDLDRPEQGSPEQGESADQAHRTG